MLILSRKEGDQIVVDLRPVGKGLVTIVVTCIDGAKVKIGVKADRDVKVVRKELLDG